MKWRKMNIHKCMWLGIDGGGYQAYVWRDEGNTAKPWVAEVAGGGMQFPVGNFLSPRKAKAAAALFAEYLHGARRDVAAMAQGETVK